MAERGRLDVADAIRTRAQVVEALRRLSRQQRQVIYLRFGVGLSLAEAAAVMCCARATVQTHERRAKQRLGVLAVIQVEKIEAPPL